VTASKNKKQTTWQKVDAVCALCQIAFIGNSYKGKEVKYCSRRCAIDSLKLQKLERKNIQKQCLLCHKEFLVNRWKASQKFCSVKCSGRHNEKYGGSVKMPCATCGQLVSRSPGKVRGKVYCGYKCMAVGKTLAAPRTNNWANVRAWFSRFNRMSECECCGFKELPGILVIHHKDRDRKNNALSNLTVLCPNCHATEHYRENKEGWKHKSNDPRKVKMREEAAARLVSS
jgi:endogenous inhibitor of DNA gyrase (YacG/DUF329 family)